MGLNKRFITKDKIVYFIKNENITSLIREMKINELFNCDTLVMDTWSSKFYRDLKPEERKIRDNIREKYKFDSGANFINDDDYKCLTSLSEALISLCSEFGSWIDVHLVVDKLQIPIESFESGRYEIVTRKCIDAIIKHFDS